MEIAHYTIVLAGLTIAFAYIHTYNTLDRNSSSVDSIVDTSASKMIIVRKYYICNKIDNLNGRSFKLLNL